MASKFDLGQENISHSRRMEALKPTVLRKKTAFKPFADAKSTISSRSNRRRVGEAATQTELPPAFTDANVQTGVPDAELAWLTAEEQPDSPEYLARLAESRRQALSESLEENAKLAEENRQLTDLLAAMINDADAAAAAIAESAAYAVAEDGSGTCPHCGGRGTSPVAGQE
ncbi:hypothetical protein BOX15_Mlig001505g11 [Macrostomum lignano]|uniref:Geminin n=1 Tax=Macrostomum lignano TaxID=282301 RepID=A0A267G4B9_9PLAT|nr:hypothetical protein BOX15_Mlig001505g11 [Macrostomum lignano]